MTMIRLHRSVASVAKTFFIDDLIVVNTRLAIHSYPADFSITIILMFRPSSTKRGFSANMLKPVQQKRSFYKKRLYQTYWHRCLGRQNIGLLPLNIR